MAKIDAVHAKRAQAEAAAYREWEHRVLQEAMGSRGSVADGDLQVTVQGGCGPSSTDALMTQSMQWTVRPGEHMVIRVEVGPRHTASDRARNGAASGKGHAASREDREDHEKGFDI